MDVGPAAVAALVLTLAFPGLLLAALLVPAVALPLPLPSAVAEAEPTVATPGAPPNVGREGAAAPAKGEDKVLSTEEPKLSPEEAKLNVAAAGESAACPNGLGSAAGAA